MYPVGNELVMQNDNAPNNFRHDIVIYGGRFILLDLLCSKMPYRKFIAMVAMHRRHFRYESIAPLPSLRSVKVNYAYT